MNNTMAEENKIAISVYDSFNIFVYKPRDLWLSYGIAAAAAFLCIATGGFAMWRNGGCYQTAFSTFVRATRDEDVSRLIVPTDSGAGPLPKDLAEAKLVLASSMNGIYKS